MTVPEIVSCPPPIEPEFEEYVFPNEFIPIWREDAP